MRAEDALQPLNIKPGLWEITRVREVNGKTEVKRSCVRKEDLTKPFVDYRARGPYCTRTIITSTASLQEIRNECRFAEGGETGTLRMEVVDSGNVTGTRKLIALDGSMGENRTSNHSYIFTAKWIGPSCTVPKK